MYILVSMRYEKHYIPFITVSSITKYCGLCKNGVLPAGSATGYIKKLQSGTFSNAKNGYND